MNFVIENTSAITYVHYTYTISWEASEAKNSNPFQFFFENFENNLKVIEISVKK